MPSALNYPGVYIEEIPSGVRTVVGVSTSMTAFVGRARKGPVNEPVIIHGFDDYERAFGDLWLESPMSFAVEQYFLNGGSDAVIVRVVSAGAAKARITLPAAAGKDPLRIEAASEGEWGNALRALVDRDIDKTMPGYADTLFNLTVQLGEDTALDRQRETFRNLSPDPAHARYVESVLREDSRLVNAAISTSSVGVEPSPPNTWSVPMFAERGHDGDPLTGPDVEGKLAPKTGFHALLKTDLFNLLCIPPLQFSTPANGGVGCDVEESTWSNAATFCEEHRAFLLIDSPASSSKDKIKDLKLGTSANAALYYPRVRLANRLRENRLEDFAPCGVVAGVIARTDRERGIWKAPAGIETALRGVNSLTYKLSDQEQGELNPLGINALRTFPVVGSVVWGARTLRGADRLTSEWKYVPVRRLALYIEETLLRGTQWVVFEPNDEPLWSQIRLNIGAFMSSLFRQGAFQGRSPAEAYLVKCDRQTTTQDDVNRGVVNIVVGFAPLKPAEFVVLKLSQLAGQSQL